MSRIKKEKNQLRTNRVVTMLTDVELEFLRDNIENYSNYFRHKLREDMREVAANKVI